MSLFLREIHSVREVCFYTLRFFKDFKVSFDSKNHGKFTDENFVLQGIIFTEHVTGASQSHPIAADQLFYPSFFPIMHHVNDKSDWQFNILIL